MYIPIVIVNSQDNLIWIFTNDVEKISIDVYSVDILPVSKYEISVIV